MYTAPQQEPSHGPRPARGPISTTPAPATNRRPAATPAVFRKAASLVRLVQCWTALVVSSLAALAGFLPSGDLPPAPAREFRGAWVATVNNIDWPSRPGLSTAQQQQELIMLLDTAANLHLNAILFQVRPACDAMYESKFEPWSEYLTGTMGQPPQPYYDPLAFAIREAHQRGLELHAWFNPFRARHHATQGPISSRHIAKTKPQWVRNYGKYLWLDPGEPGVLDYSLRVIMDVVKRYDIDGVHLDDYFYPYKEKDAKQRPLDFPDSPTFKRYQAQGGKLAKEDWRRDQVNTFVRRLYQAIKAEKSFVKVGISPFGIWRPGSPASVRGLDAYADLYADSKKWWNSGWLDYLAPQLYWSIDAKEQGFAQLLKWWGEQNQFRRHLWPGLATDNVGGRYPASEIVNQISMARSQLQADGEIHWSIKSLLQNRQNVRDLLASGPYANRVLSPSFPWLDRDAPARPLLTVSSNGASRGLVLGWENTSPENTAQWVVQLKHSGAWRTEIYPGGFRGCSLPAELRPDAVAVSAVDRCGNLSAPAVLAYSEDRSIAAPKPNIAATERKPNTPTQGAANTLSPSTAAPSVTPAPQLRTAGPSQSASAREAQNSDRSRVPSRTPPRPVLGSAGVTGR